MRKTNCKQNTVAGWLLLLLLATVAPAQTAYFGKWPAGASPQEVGRRVAENFAARKFDFATNPNRKYVIYPEVCAWYGALSVAKLSNNKDLQTRLMEKFDPLP